MITIIHGNDITTSRNFYIELRKKTANYELIDGKNLDFDTLFRTFEGNSLFTNEKNIYIENFFSNIKSNSIEFKKITDYLNKNKNINLLFWEAKVLTKTQASSIKSAQVKEFSYPQVLFVFLDSFKPQNLSSIKLFHQLNKTMEVELIFYMIVRQLRLMIAVLEEGKNEIDEIKRLAPWQLSKLRSQGGHFGKNKLLDLYKKLYLIDYQTKYGLTPLSLSTNIDIFLSDL